MSARGFLAAFGVDEPGLLEGAARRHGLRAQPLPAGSFYLGSDLAVTREGAAIIIGDAFPHPVDGTQRWGDYLRFVFAGRARCQIDRAPLTGMPLYWARWQGGFLCFSHLHLAEDLLPTLAIDWDFVRHSLAYRNYRCERTGIAGVSELLPGMRLTIHDRAASTHCFWLPWPYASVGADVDKSRAAAMVRQCGLMCVERWAARPGEILVELSGGLDSSIIAAALTACGRAFTGVNAATATPDGDERCFARAVAAASGIRLFERRIGDADPDLLAPPARRTSRPAAAAILDGFDAAIASAIAQGQEGAQLWSGIGGDNVFAFSHSVSPAIDALLLLRWRAPLAQLLGDIAVVAGTTYWDAAKYLARRLMRGAARPDWPRDDIFAARSALPTAPFAHPWRADADTFPPGKRQHVEGVMRILDFLDKPDRWHDRKLVAPLLSQPLVETCLAIPSWHWIAGGRDRAVARAAFAPYLPQAIIARRTKGRLEALCAAVFERAREDLAAFLLGGRLASQGLLDRKAMEGYFARDGVDPDFAYFRLLEIADLERWVRAIEAASRPGGASAAQRLY
ncbi:asparagine synthase-related protein [Sphingopyxis sp. MWB1]|uniref:asparagine synthase-related protein n=1 Tax=Sphingopyxis sp. MWB1 TaxID=1537715 RepID=UPI000519F3E9|nr:asparagine synthase C-terminal domain-containing protein [Sphingopyxis sp. MWB1]